MNAIGIQGLEIMDLFHLHGCKPQVKPVTKQQTTIAKGQCQLSKTLSDITIHISDVEELQPISVSCERSSELTIGLLLEGKLQFTLDNQHITLEAPAEGKALAFAFNIGRPTRWHREFIVNNHVKKILFCLPHPWLVGRFRGHCELNRFIQQLLLRQGAESVISETINQNINSVANVFQRCCGQAISDIELEGIALTAIVHILNLLKEHQPLDSITAMQNQIISTDALKICEFIEANILNSNPPRQLKLTSIANQLGMSVSTAQRAFKQHFQQTIMEYVRVRRLEIARNQLQQQLSIGEVSYRAGYTHTTNFSLAFKKHFGVSPGEISRIY